MDDLARVGLVLMESAFEARYFFLTIGGIVAAWWVCRTVYRASKRVVNAMPPSRGRAALLQLGRIVRYAGLALLVMYVLLMGWGWESAFITSIIGTSPIALAIAIALPVVGFLAYMIAEIRRGRRKKRKLPHQAVRRFMTKNRVLACIAILCLAGLVVGVTVSHEDKPAFHEVKTASHEDEQHDTLLEVIDVEGTCAEDDVGQADSYAGQIVRWKMAETGKISTYGFVTATNINSNITERVEHPSGYHTPDRVAFGVAELLFRGWRKPSASARQPPADDSLQALEIDIDTNQPEWTLHGVSDHGEYQQGFRTTCQLKVTKRGTEIGTTTVEKLSEKGAKFIQSNDGKQWIDIKTKKVYDVITGEEVK